MLLANSGLSSSVTVSKPTPYDFDLGNLLATDPNPVTSTAEESLRSTARDGAQALLNQCLTTCTITSTPAGVLLNLPAATTPLPREKRVPVEKPLTKWQQFAARKGIEGNQRRDGKMVYDEETGEWVPKWGYKGINKKGEGDWLVEVNEKKEQKGKEQSVGDAGEGRGLGRQERKERIRRNDRRMRSNEQRHQKGGV